MNDADLFDVLGFKWDRAVVPAIEAPQSVELACFRFKRLLPQFVWDAGVLEDNPFTFPEVQTLLEGVTAGGHKIADQEQILNLAESARLLLDMVKRGIFEFEKPVFCQLHAVIARGEALEYGHFRGEGQIVSGTISVALGEKGSYFPLATESGAPELNRFFAQGMAGLKRLEFAFERALAFFLFGALQQFFFDGNKRTARYMMNGELMSHGIDAISVPAARKLEFNTKMRDFYVSKDGTEMMAFLASCHPAAGGMATVS